MNNTQKKHKSIKKNEYPKIRHNSGCRFDDNTPSLKKSINIYENKKIRNPKIGKVINKSIKEILWSGNPCPTSEIKTTFDNIKKTINEIPKGLYRFTLPVNSGLYERLSK